jgi:hypothetical protein
MSKIPEEILQSGCTAYSDIFLSANGSFGEGIEAAYFAIHDHDDWVRAGLKEWNGEGLPPVGTVCDLKFDHWTDWERHEILCHGNTFMFVRELSSGLDREGSMSMDGIMFRAVRTHEQIAAEERKKEILQMIDVFGTDTAIWGLDAVREICGHLWEAGYRKQ